MLRGSSNRDIGHLDVEGICPIRTPKVGALDSPFCSLASQIRYGLNRKAETLHNVPDGRFTKRCFRVILPVVCPRLCVLRVEAVQPLAMRRLKLFL